MSNKRTARRTEREPWVEVPVPTVVLGASPGTRGWQKDLADGHLSVFVSREPSGWHLSISHRRGRDNRPGRYPGWDEIADARYQFCPPEVTMAMLLPPLEEYVNLHETTFHLWQVNGEVPHA
jgi:hypothetical protein